MWQGKITILANKEIAPDYFKIVLRAPQVAEEAEAGQFVHLRVSDGYDPLLRRPLSIHRILKLKAEKLSKLKSGELNEGKLKAEKLKAENSRLQSIEVLYEVVGKGTKILAEKRAGEEIDILGPLGKGFYLPEDLKTAILVAGGVGVAPLLSLADDLRGKVKNAHVIIGARTEKLVLCEDDFRDLSMEVKVATDDGSKGHKGLATDLLEQHLSTLDLQPSTTVYACGPEKMLRKAASIAVSRGIFCQLSLESRMGCGVGACQGCVVKIKDKKSKMESYKRVCKDGPVFEAREIIWG